MKKGWRRKVVDAGREERDKFSRQGARDGSTAEEEDEGVEAEE